MYREQGTRPAGELPPSELVYSAVDRADRQRVGMLVFQLGGVGILVVSVLSAFATPELGLAGLAVSTGAIVWWWRRARSARLIVLRVERDELHVRLGGSSRMMRLGDLVDVALDIKTIQRVVDGDSAIPALRFADSRIAPEVDTARIVLVGAEGQVPLTKEYVAHMDATEWLSKSRVFLRKHGWVPDDERDAPEE